MKKIKNKRYILFKKNGLHSTLLAKNSSKKMLMKQLTLISGGKNPFCYILYKYSTLHKWIVIPEKYDLFKMLH